MGPARRQVQHVAGVEQVLFLGLKVAEDLERHVRLQRQVFLATDAPMALAAGLQQEHVVAVKVRPDAAAIAGPGNHQVVQPGVGHEPEALKHLVGHVQMQVHTLHQQGPAFLLQRRKSGAGERAVLELPASRLAHDHARFNRFFGGHGKQRLAVQERLEIRKRVADQQRFFLPIAAHELRGRETAEHFAGHVGAEGFGVGWGGLGHGTIVR
ncbi:hypothetical protein Y695_02721 [Hydrogenophaga sp. T4]|nr:hypothetical protein Y695_02721 [Hydrogenophaga sp. T4]